MAISDSMSHHGLEILVTGGSVEATLELWAASLRDVKGRISPVFRQQRMAQSAGLFLDARRAVPGCPAGARAAQDGLDASRGSR